MLLRSLTVMAVLATLASPAVAFNCPIEIKKVDAVLASELDISQDRRNHAKSLREWAEELHQAGKHKRSLEVLTRAKIILGSPK